MSNKPTYEELERKVEELEKDNSRYLQTETLLRRNEERYYDTITHLNEGFYSVSLDGTLLDHNNRFKKILGLDLDKDFKGLQLPDFWQNPEEREIYIDKLMKIGFIKDYEINAKKSDGELIVIQTNSRLVQENDGRELRIEGSFLDVTEKKQVEEELKQVYIDLETKVKERSFELSELNTSLKVLLRKSEEDKSELEEKVLSNMNKLILPILNKIKRDPLSNRQMNSLITVESNLKKITSTFSRTLSLEYSLLTPTEIQIANLLKEGKTSKEIVELTSSTLSTINFHRRNLRKKLGLKNKNKNLKNHLLSIQY